MKDRFAIVAVADPDEARARDAAERTGAAIVTFEEAIERDDVDIVDLCTPPSLHLEQITAALAAGKHVVCEKPLVASLRDCDTLAEAEAASAGRLMPIFQYRFGNGLQKVKALVDRGVAGPAYTVVGRGRVAAAGRLLRGAVARAVGDRARRRAPQPGGPRHRHAHLHRRPPSEGLRPRRPPA